MLFTAIPDNGLWIYRTSYAVRSAITATAERLLHIIILPIHMQRYRKASHADRHTAICSYLLLALWHILECAVGEGMGLRVR